MKRDIDKTHPIWMYFSEQITDSLENKLGLEEPDEVKAYLTDMLVDFVHSDEIFSIRDAAGQPVESVTEMLAEADVLLNADSFDRERQVHRHIGDFLLFWSGLFPEYLQQLKAPTAKDALLDVTKQGSYSYHVVSTFDHPPYEEEAETFRRLSARFESYQRGLLLVRASFEGFALQGWTHGFGA